MVVDLEVEMIPQREKLPSGLESTQRSSISQRKVPENLFIYKAELELSMSHENTDKSHSEGSDTHIHEPVQTVLQILQRKEPGNSATNPPRSDELLANPEGGGNSDNFQWN
ncbi:hypothetical protein O181_065501 [Austropuccinia psidii MF-1]|uniref:Uncharacterized protein n=1 Tax=Austropuccinia psidii MF-1 TaxID=1389203 RepID=A0A9Q3EVR4_9BASI|nr:hypothetical protein [Austropuccinia psidii MF-1]